MWAAHCTWVFRTYVDDFWAGEPLGTFTTPNLAFRGQGTPMASWHIVYGEWFPGHKHWEHW